MMISFRTDSMTDFDSPLGLDLDENRAPPQCTALPQGVKWGWSVRDVAGQGGLSLDERPAVPRSGDIVVAEVKSISHHTRLTVADQARLRMYPGDWIVGVFGNRYATDAFEAKVDGIDDLHMLTDSGMIGTVCSKHRNMKSPTRLSFRGFLADEAGHRINLTARRFHPSPVRDLPTNVVMVVGSGMNSGKTTTASKLIESLERRGVRVAACKLTGSVSSRDLTELRSTGAKDFRDFSTYGFPSTYLASRDELLGLFNSMLSDANLVQPDLVVMEVADGLLQRETATLLKEPRVRRRLCGVLLSAGCSSSALFGVQRLASLGHRVLGVSGLITSSPLFMQEFCQHSPVPVATSAGSGGDLADLILRRVALATTTAAINPHHSQAA